MAAEQNALGSPGVQAPSPAAWGEPLRLRFLGTSRKGQLIQLNGNRVTVGSAPHCGVRLRLQGVRPLQCLIVRGPHGAVARSLSIDTLLNGHRFREELLTVGDRIQMGPVEFEVCNDGRPFLAPPPANNATPPRANAANVTAETKPEAATWLHPQPLSAVDLLNRLERLEQHLGHAAGASPPATTSPAASNTLEAGDVADPSPIVDSGSQATPDAATSNPDQDRLAELEQGIAQLRDELERTSDRCHRAEDELVVITAQRDELLNRLQALSDQLQTTEERLHGLQEATELRQSHDAEAIQATNAQWHSKLADTAAKMQQIQQELAVRSERWRVIEQQKSDLEEQLSRQQAQREELEKQLAQQSAELAASRERCEDLSRELAEATKRAFALPPATSPVTTVENAQAFPTVKQPPGELSWLASHFQAAETTQTETELNATATSLPRSEPTTAASSPEEHVPAPHLATPATDSSPTETTSPSFPIRQSSLFTAQFLEDLEREQQAANGGDTRQTAAGPVQAEVSSSYTSSLVEPADAETANRAPEVALKATADQELSSNQTESEDPAFNDALARLARAGIWKSDDQPKSSTEEDQSESEPETNEPGIVAHRPDREPEEDVTPAEPLRASSHASDRPREHAAPHHGTGEEDSIETYMQQLLQRMRGETESIKPKQNGNPRVVSEVNVPEEDVARPKPLVEEPSVLSQEEYQPRSMAPEANANLQAMRQLANDNRQDHILKHAQRTWQARSRNKLIGSAAGVATAFAAFFFLDTHTLPAVAALFCGMGVAGYLIWQAYQYRRQLFDSLRLVPPEEVDPRDGGSVS